MSRLSSGANDSGAHNILPLAENNQSSIAKENIYSFSKGRLWTMLNVTKSTPDPCELTAQKCDTLSVSLPPQPLRLKNCTTPHVSSNPQHQPGQVNDQTLAKKRQTLAFKSDHRGSVFQKCIATSTPVLLSNTGFNTNESAQNQLEEATDEASEIVTSFPKSEEVHLNLQFEATIRAYCEQPHRDDVTRSTYAKSLEHYATQAQADDIGEATKYRLAIAERLFENPSDILQDLRKKCNEAGFHGVNIQGLDEHLIADRSMHVRYVRGPEREFERESEGDFFRVDLDLTNIGHQNLQSTLQAIEKNTDKFASVINEKGFGKVDVKKKEYSYVTNKKEFLRYHFPTKGTKIHIEGLGTILIPSGLPALKKRVSFEVQASSTNEEEKNSLS